MDLLSDVRVVEAASYFSGPFGTLMLADLGATVTKVEPAPAGEPFRGFGKRSKGHGLQFVNLTRGKRSVLLDLKDPAGLARLHELLEDADVFVTNWRPGVAENLGLEPAAVRARHPGLIWIRISGFGQDGPMGNRPAFDQIVQARSGLATVQGDDKPELIRSYFADKVAATFVAQSALAALHDRNRTGTGRVIDLAMLDAVAYFNFPDLMANHTIVAHEPGGRSHAGAVRPIATKDGWLVVSPVTGSQIAASFTALERPDCIARLKAVSDPAEMTALMYDLLEEATRERTSAECEERFAAHDVPSSAVLDLTEHLADPQVQHSGLYLTVEDPDIGAFRRVRYPAIVDGRPEAKPGPTFPRPGEHG